MIRIENVSLSGSETAERISRYGGTNSTNSYYSAMSEGLVVGLPHQFYLTDIDMESFNCSYMVGFSQFGE